MTKGKQADIRLDPHFAAVVKAFAKQRSVSRRGTKGLVTGALMVDARIFAMISSKGEFVVTPPRKESMRW